MNCEVCRRARDSRPARTPQQTWTGAFSVDLATLRRPLRVSGKAWLHHAKQINLGERPVPSLSRPRIAKCTVGSGLKLPLLNQYDHLC